MNVIFLDIDGVLNDHAFNDEACSLGLLPRCVAELNRVIRTTDARLVISSAWRYMISGGGMTVSGFDYLLRTHGVIANRVIGYTRNDIMDSDDDRCDQIAEWIAANSAISSWIVIDDEPPGMVASPAISRLIKTDGKVGLTTELADRAIHLLQT